MRTKEFGIVVPAVLLGYEMTLGERKWVRSLPYFLPAAIFGALGLIYNSQQHSSYSFQFGLASIWKTTLFYASVLFGNRYTGFLILLVPILVRDRRVYFGLVVVALGLAVYVLLPERRYAVYLCFAMTGVAMMAAVLALKYPRVTAALLLAWAVRQYVLIHRNTAATVVAGADRRAFVDAVRRVPDSPIYVWDNIPASMHSWGVDGTLYLFHKDIQKILPIGAQGLTPGPGMLWINWDAAARRLDAAPFHPEEVAYVREDRPAPPWQFRAGWQSQVNGYRRISKQATVRLYRAPNVTEVEWDACSTAPAELRTFVEGEELPKIVFQQERQEEKCVHGKGTLKPGPSALVSLDFLISDPPGTARIGDFGFVAPPPK
jgi:hypothetical protein